MRINMQREKCLIWELENILATTTDAMKADHRCPYLELF